MGRDDLTRKRLLRASICLLVRLTERTLASVDVD